MGNQTAKLVTDFEKDVVNCTKQAAQDRIDGSDKKVVDDKLQACLQDKIDKRKKQQKHSGGAETNASTSAAPSAPIHKVILGHRRAAF